MLVKFVFVVFLFGGLCDSLPANEEDIPRSVVQDEQESARYYVQYLNPFSWFLKENESDTSLERRHEILYRMLECIIEMGEINDCREQLQEAKKLFPKSAKKNEGKSASTEKSSETNTTESSKSSA